MISNDTILAVGVPLASGFVAFLVGWGYMKGEKKIFLTHPQHREICEVVKEGESAKRSEIYGVMREGFDSQGQKMDELIRAVGRIEGALRRDERS